MIKLGPASRMSWHEHALMRSLARRGWTHTDLIHAFGRANSTVLRHVAGIRTQKPASYSKTEQRRIQRQQLRDAWRCIDCRQPTGAHPPMIASPCRCSLCAERHRK